MRGDGSFLLGTGSGRRLTSGGALACGLAPRAGLTAAHPDRSETLARRRVQAQYMPTMNADLGLDGKP